MFELISFDLQGTLSNSAFSDEFWLEVLPEIYAEYHQVQRTAAVDDLRVQFKQMGKYDRRYYCPRYWLDLLKRGCTLADFVPVMRSRPHLFDDTMQLVAQLRETGVPLLITSTTTHDFIDLELGQSRRFFCEVISAIDDLGIAGKTPQVFQYISSKYNVPADRILHIGDCSEMDIANATTAGCKAFFWDKKQERVHLLAALRTMLVENLCVINTL